MLLTFIFHCVKAAGAFDSEFQVNAALPSDQKSIGNQALWISICMYREEGIVSHSLGSGIASFIALCYTLHLWTTFMFGPLHIKLMINCKLRP